MLPDVRKVGLSRLAKAAGAEVAEYRKTYNLIEVNCEVCECKVKKCRWSKHILTKNIWMILRQKVEIVFRINYPRNY